VTLAPPPQATSPEGPPDPPVEANAEVTKQIRGSSLLMVGRVVSIITNLVVQVLLVRSLSKGDFGIFAYALSIVTMIGTVSTFGLDRGLSRFLAIYEERGEKAKLWGVLVLQLATILGLGLAATALVIGFHGWIGRTLVDDARLGTLLAVMVLLAPLQALDGVAAGIFSAFGQSKEIFLRRYVLAPVLRLVIVGLLVLGDRDVFFLGAGYVAAGAFGLALYGSLLLRTFQARGLLTSPDGSPRKLDLPIAEVGAFTVPLLASDAMFVVLNTSDVVILGRTAGATAVSSYRAILPVARLNQLALNSFSLLFAPLMARLWARGDRRALGDAYWQTAAWVAVLSFPLFAVVIGLAEPLVVTLFGERYASSVPYLRILATAYYFNAALGFNGVTLKMIGRVWLSASLALGALAFNLAINLLLIPRYGALGAAWGTGLTVAGFNVAKQVALHKGSSVTGFDRRYASLYATILGAAAALLAVDLVGAPIVLRAVVVAAASAAVLAVGRRLLLVGDLFPEVAKLPLVGRLLAPAGRSTS
jgi:O-antigen/teichoic acid export membrane protein